MINHEFKAEASRGVGAIAGDIGHIESINKLNPRSCLSQYWLMDCNLIAKWVKKGINEGAHCDTGGGDLFQQGHSLATAIHSPLSVRRRPIEFHLDGKEAPNHCYCYLSSLPYVGWLSDSTRTAMVFEYCSRGSLQDVLIMDDIKLDWSFRLSLLTDLVRVRHFNRIIIIFIFIRPQPKLDP